MRVSVDKDDPGFDPRNAMHAQVFLDDKLVDLSERLVITADEEAGLLICYKREQPGGKIILTDDGSEPERYRITGKVRIVIPKRDPLRPWLAEPSQFVVLQTREGEFVSLARIPQRLIEPPEIMLWGQRMFRLMPEKVHIGNADKAKRWLPAYREGKLWTVQDPSPIFEFPEE